MAEYLTEHWILSILVTILLGALGSGLWESVFKPLFYKMGKVLFTLLTFGLKRASDNVYKEAARGHHEFPSLIILMFIFVAIFAFFFNSGVNFYFELYSRDSSIEEALQKCVDKKNNEYEDCIQEVTREKVWLPIRLLALCAIFISVVLLYRLMTIFRINLVITYYEQCLKICIPFLSAEEISKVEQRFALMESKEDYLKIIEKLGVVAEKGAIKLPEPYY